LNVPFAAPGFISREHHRVEDDDDHGENYLWARTFCNSLNFQGLRPIDFNTPTEARDHTRSAVGIVQAEGVLVETKQRRAKVMHLQTRCVGSGRSRHYSQQFDPRVPAPRGSSLCRLPAAGGCVQSLAKPDRLPPRRFKVVTLASETGILKRYAVLSLAHYPALIRKYY